MTPEQKIIAIAEFEGIPAKKVWRVRYKDKSFDYNSEFEATCSVAKATHDFNLEESEIGKIEPVEVPSRLSPYLTSRDSICGAVARLDDEQKDKFANYLYDIYLGFNEDPEFHQSELHLSAKSVTNMILATPAQLADALLLTLGHEI